MCQCLTRQPHPIRPDAQKRRPRAVRLWGDAYRPGANWPGWGDRASDAPRGEENCAEHVHEERVMSDQVQVRKFTPLCRLQSFGNKHDPDQTDFAKLLIFQSTTPASQRTKVPAAGTHTIVLRAPRKTIPRHGHWSLNNLQRRAGGHFAAFEIAVYQTQPRLGIRWIR